MVGSDGGAGRPGVGDAHSVADDDVVHQLGCDVRPHPHPLAARRAADQRVVNQRRADRKAGHSAQPRGSPTARLVAGQDVVDDDGVCRIDDDAPAVRPGDVADDDVLRDQRGRPATAIDVDAPAGVLRRVAHDLVADDGGNGVVDDAQSPGPSGGVLDDVVVEDLGGTPVDEDRTAVAGGVVALDSIVVDDGRTAIDVDPTAGVVAIAPGDDEALDRRPGPPDDDHPTPSLGIQDGGVSVRVGRVGEIAGRGVAAPHRHRLADVEHLGEAIPGVDVGVDPGGDLDHVARVGGVDGRLHRRVGAPAGTDVQLGGGTAGGPGVALGRARRRPGLRHPRR